MRDHRWPRRFDDGRGSRHFDFLGASFALLGSRSSGFRRGACSFFGAQRFHADCFDARRLGGGGFLRRLRFRGGLGGRGRGGSMLFGRCLDVGGFAPATYGLARSGGGNGLGFRRHDRRASTATSGRGRRRLFLGASTLLALPPSADASYLIVRERAHVTANGNVHRPKKCLHIFDGHSEFTGQLTD